MLAVIAQKAVHRNRRHHEKVPRPPTFSAFAFAWPAPCRGLCFPDHELVVPTRVPGWDRNPCLSKCFNVPALPLRGLEPGHANYPSDARVCSLWMFNRRLVENLAWSRRIRGTMLPA